TVSRRQFLAGAAVTTLTTLSIQPRTEAQRNLTIERIEAFPVLYPTVMRFKFFEGPKGEGRPAVLIKVTASDGTVGWGESVPVPRWSYETLEGATAAIREYLTPVLIGMNVFDLPAIHEAMNREI